MGYLGIDISSDWLIHRLGLNMAHYDCDYCGANMRGCDCAENVAKQTRRLKRGGWTADGCFLTRHDKDGELSDRIRVEVASNNSSHGNTDAMARAIMAVINGPIQSPNKGFKFGLDQMVQHKRKAAFGKVYSRTEDRKGGVTYTVMVGTHHQPDIVTWGEDEIKPYVEPEGYI